MNRNIKVLKNTLDLFKSYLDTYATDNQDFFYHQASIEALSEIEKCEPVAILHRKLVEVYNPKLTLHEKADITFLNTDEANKESEMRYIQLPDGDYKLYTSPISKECQREGWVSVPIEPTKEMIQAACLNQAVNSFKTYEEWAESHSNGIVEKIVGLEIATYKAMISAAPKE